MSRKNLHIGLFGFGCVGHGLYEVLERTPALQARIRKICVKDQHKQRPIPSGNFTFNREEILRDPEINVVVELIDDADAAFEIVSEALKQGKAVVTANKKMIAEHFDDLLELQKRYQAPLLYEAACCASIPIIRNLEEYYDNDLLESIEGIVNGSTNYILTQISSTGATYASALANAQAKGYAESNPILDTGGFDAKYKLLILIAHAFGWVAEPDDIFNLGIDRLGELELNYAREKGWKIKLVAHAEKTAAGQIRAWVLPKFISKEDKFYAVDDVFNGVKTESCFSDTQFFVGKGAGAYPTASAVLSDISALSYDYRYEYKKLNREEGLVAARTVLLKVLLRYSPSADTTYRLSFVEVQEAYQNVDAAYLIGIISLQELQRISADSSTSFVLFEAIDLKQTVQIKHLNPEASLALA